MVPVAVFSQFRRPLMMAILREAGRKYVLNPRGALDGVRPV
ncbi:hypothetical protein [Streptomyces cyaneus]|nr:hypothetical protein [Streptomyces cyaneus]